MPPLPKSPDPGSDEPLELEIEPEPHEWHQSRDAAEEAFPSVVLPKTLFRLRLRLVDGVSLEGDIFLGTSHDGSIEEELLHFLQELRDGFFPLREPGGGAVPLVHTRAVQWLAARLERPEPSYAERRHVLVDLGHGQMLEGDVILDVDIIRPRVSDLLNQFRPYLALHTGSELYLVNRYSILRVFDLGPV
jgi:hypothetical protein